MFARLIVVWNLCVQFFKVLVLEVLAEVYAWHS